MAAVAQFRAIGAAGATETSQTSAVESSLAEIPRGVRQLFFDDLIVARAEKLVRTVHQPVKHPDNPVLKREHPWEGYRVQVYGTVIYQPQKKQRSWWKVSEK